MPLLFETTLTAIPASETERLLLVLVHSAEHGSRMELRQQSFSKGIGWFTQSTVQLEPSQVAATDLYDLEGRHGRVDPRRVARQLPLG